MSHFPLKPLRDNDNDDDGAPCPAYYAEDASAGASGAAESQPFIRLSERDVEAARASLPPPPTYAETQQRDDWEMDKDEDPFKGKPVAVRILLTLLSVLMFAVGFGAVLTLFIVFFRILVLVWRRLGLL